MEGFLSNRQYAAMPEVRFIRKLACPRWRECSIWQMFFSSSLMVSMTERLRKRIFSLMPISWFFMLLLIPVTRCIPSFQRVSNKCFDIYPLSANRSPNNLRLNTLKTSGFLSSTLPFVRQKFNNSPGRCRRGGA